MKSNQSEWTAWFSRNYDIWVPRLQRDVSGKMAVSLSGTVISSLFFEQGNSNSDQEGFLLGKVVSHVTDAISDSQLTTTKEETFTYVYSYLPCPGLFSWYSSSGKIVLEKLRQLLPGDKYKEVVGWYKFRRCSSLQVSLREHYVHRHLKEAFPGINNHHFLFCLCTVATSGNSSTHSWDHVFLNYDGCRFRPLPVTVDNLGDTAPADYRVQSSSNSSPEGSTYTHTIRQFMPTFVDSSGNMQSVISTHNLNSHLHRELLDLSHSVAQSEKEVAQLKAEVTLLQRQLKPLPPPPVPPSTQRGLKELKPAKKGATLRPPKKPLPQPDSETSSDDRNSSSDQEMMPSPSALEPDLIVFDEPPKAGRGKDSHTKPVSEGDGFKVTEPVSVSNVDLLTGITDTPPLLKDNPVPLVTPPDPDIGHENESQSRLSLRQDLGSDSDSALDSNGLSGQPSLAQSGDAFSFVGEMLSQAKPLPAVTREQAKAKVAEESSVSSRSQKPPSFSRSNSMPRHTSRAIKVHRKSGSDKGAKVTLKTTNSTEENMDFDESDSPVF